MSRLEDILSIPQEDLQEDDFTYDEEEISRFLDTFAADGD